jgi:ParB family chromosome partitioning protein
LRWSASAARTGATRPEKIMVIQEPERNTERNELIEISQIKITLRMRRTDEDRIRDLAESIKGIGLLHPVSVAEKDGEYILLAGFHRIGAYKILGLKQIPSTIRKSDEIIDQLIACEENLVRSELNAIQTAEHIVRREELLIALGRKAVVGNNQYTESKITNEDLARQMGFTRRTYQYKRSVANLNEEAKDLLCETRFAENLMDMVKLQKEPDHIQIEIAKLLASGESNTFRRAWVVAHMKNKKDNWTEDVKSKKEAIGIPKSIMRWDRTDNELTRICSLVSGSEELQKIKVNAQFGTNQIHNYTMNPEQSRWFVEFYSKRGELVLDNFCGRGTNIITAAYLGRRCVAYDLSTANLASIRTACLEHTNISDEDLVLHQSCGIELAEYADDSDIFDLILNDPPYIYGAEEYGDDKRDLSLVKSIGSFNERMEICLINLKRLIKPSNFQTKEFHPIIMKLGSGRRGQTGLIDMSSEVETIARKIGLVIHDKIFNELRSAFQSFNLKRCLEHKYTVKSHETNLVMVKYL